MSDFCDHCQGQRFDRARVLRILRQLRSEMRRSPGAARALGAALDAVRRLDVPHLEVETDDHGPLVH